MDCGRECVLWKGRGNTIRSGLHAGDGAGQRDWGREGRQGPPSHMDLSITLRFHSQLILPKTITLPPGLTSVCFTGLVWMLLPPHSSEA